MLGVARGELGDHPLGLRPLGFYLRPLGGQAGGICGIIRDQIVRLLVDPRFSGGELLLQRLDVSLQGLDKHAVRTGCALGAHSLCARGAHGVRMLGQLNAGFPVIASPPRPFAPQRPIPDRSAVVFSRSAASR